MKRRTIIFLLVLVTSLQALAVIQYDWKAINHEIQTLERAKCSDKKILSKLSFVREKSILPGRQWYEPNDTLFIVEKINRYDLHIDFWQNSDYTDEYWNVSNSRNPKDQVIYVERFEDEYQRLSPSDQRRFVLCYKMDADALNLESKNCEKMLCEDPTSFTFFVRIIFNDNNRYTIDLFRVEGYDGFK